jgi:hypothetical protein
LLTEVEAMVVNDGVGPIYRQCEQCEKTTGWIKASRSLEPEPARTLPGKPASGSTAVHPVPKGQERMANQSELDELDSLLQRLHSAGGGDDN